MKSSTFFCPCCFTTSKPRAGASCIRAIRNRRQSQTKRSRKQLGFERELIMEKQDSDQHTGLAKVMFIVKLLEIRMRFVLVLVVTALVVGCWDTITNYVARWMRPAMTA